MNIIPIMPRKSAISFERKLREDEKPVYKKSLNEALDYLDVKNVAMICHGSSFPAMSRDTHIGSPYSKSADKFVDFLNLHGFNSIQLGPGGAINKKDPSPYISKVFAKNEMFVDLAQLTTDKYANILSKDSYNAVTTRVAKNGTVNAYSDFDKAFATYGKAMTEAYVNFRDKVASNDKTAVEMNKKFDNFKETNKNWLEQDGMFYVLTRKYQTDDINKWDKIDANLNTGVKNGDKDSIKRYNQILKDNKEEVEKNSFKQFLADEQLKDSNKTREGKNFKYIGDLLVGFAKSDVWANKDAFLEGWKLGCPFGGVDNGPQTWGIPVLNPKKLFNQDGTLGESGKVLKEKLAYQLQNYDNVRVDHALGLVDPYLYKEDSVVKNDRGAVIRERLNANNVSYLHDVDPQGNFKKVLEKIILPTFKEHGINPREAVWEDLGSNTPAFNDIYYGKHHLPGITQTEWKRSENAPQDNWSLIGSHDSKPVQETIKNPWTKGSDAWNVDYLSGYLTPDPAKSNEKNDYKNKISSSDKELVNAKFTELFRGTKNLQIMFADFFGSDKVYNYGGQDKPTNWKLRVGNDYEDAYHKALEDGKSFALNMPEILAKAVRAKADMEVAKLGGDKVKQDAKRVELEQKLKPLLNHLDSFKGILKEKESAEVKSSPKTEDVSKPVSNPISSTVASDKSKKKDSSNSGSIATAVVGVAILGTLIKKVIDKFKAKKQEKVNNN